MTETARLANIVLPANHVPGARRFYRGGGHQYIILGRTDRAPGECRNNHEVFIVRWAQRLGAVHPGFAMTPRELID